MRPSRTGWLAAGLVALAAVALVAVMLWGEPGHAQAVGTVGRDFIMRQFGQEMGTVHIDVATDSERVSLKTSTKFPKLGVECYSEFSLDKASDEAVFPVRPRGYSFWAKAPTGRLDVLLSWGEALGYEIQQLGMKGTISDKAALPLDNNTLTDYQVLTWTYDAEKGGAQNVSVVVPTLLPRGVQVIPMSVELVGEEELSGHATYRFKVTVPGGLVMDLWVDKGNRTLVKMAVPQQGIEVVDSDLAADAGETGTSAAPQISGEYAVAERQVSIPVDGGALSGTLSLPEGLERPVAAVVLVAGSGPTDRDGNSPLVPGRVDNLKEIAQYLSSRGIAVLRYDKRGIAQSSSLLRGETPAFSVYAADVAKAVDFVRAESGADPAKVFIIGHSEGAVLAIQAALARGDLAGIVLLAGPGETMAETLKRQISAQARVMEAQGAPAGLADKVSGALEELFSAVREDRPFDVDKYGLPDELVMVFQSINLQRTFTREALFVNPAVELAKVKCPVLIIQGDADLQVRVEDAQLLAAALPEVQREVHILRGIDHVLKAVKDVPLPYGDPNRRVDAGLLEAIYGWIAKR